MTQDYETPYLVNVTLYQDLRSRPEVGGRGRGEVARTRRVPRGSEDRVPEKRRALMSKDSDRKDAAEDKRARRRERNLRNAVDGWKWAEPKGRKPICWKKGEGTVKE